MFCSCKHSVGVWSSDVRLNRIAERRHHSSVWSSRIHQAKINFPSFCAHFSIKSCAVACRAYFCTHTTAESGILSCCCARAICFTQTAPFVQEDPLQLSWSRLSCIGAIALADIVDIANESRKKHHERKKAEQPERKTGKIGTVKPVRRPKIFVSPWQSSTSYIGVDTAIRRIISPTTTQG